MKRFIPLLHLTIACLFGNDLSSLPSPYSDLEVLYPYDNGGWFDEGKAQTVERLIRKHQPVVVVELGSYLGKSTRFIARRLPMGGKVYAVDHWFGSPEHQNPDRSNVFSKLPTLYERFLSNVIHAHLCDRIVPIRALTVEAPSLVDETPDMVFVDAAHEYEDVFLDIETWYPLIRTPGVLCGDDWVWGKGNPVQRAVKDFSCKHGLEYSVRGAIWWIEKK